uniref:Nucleolar protein 56 n=2 Tax=Piliocolobus tephrosceles TaxID=591936 RepID=A0A8C9GG64_9PRIM
MKKLFILFECAAGYFLLKVEEWEQIANNDSLEKKLINSSSFQQCVKFCAFVSFDTAERALDNINSLNEGHSYSRSKLKLDPKKQDKSIINSIATIESLDKNINVFSMRVVEWYSWHFPELKNIVTDVIKYCKLVQLIGIKDKFDFDLNKDKITEITEDEEITEKIQKVSNLSVGQELSNEDLSNIVNFSNEIISLYNTRTLLWNYMDNKLNILAPNLKELVGNRLTSRLISHAGSLLNLAKSPCSSIQIFGAEKALFNSLKGNKRTPKFGIIYNSSYISKVPPKLKGKMSRYLSSKISIVTRIDTFSENPTNNYGVVLKKQLEDKILHMIKGVKLSKNIDYINTAEQLYNDTIERTRQELGDEQGKTDKKKKKKIKIKIKSIKRTRLKWT